MRSTIAILLILILALTPATGIPEEIPTLEVALLTWGIMNDPGNTRFLVEAAEEAGVNIQWIVFTNSTWEESKQMILEADNPPDIFINCVSKSDYAAHADVFEPLEGLIEKYAPNIAAAFDEDGQLRDYATESDGHIYGLACRKPFQPDTWLKWTINKAWLDRLGLNPPRTWDELKAVLRAFRDEDANGNGDPNDEIPFSFGSSALLISYLMMGGLGQYSDTRGLSCSGGRFVYLPTTQDWCETVNFMHELYEEKLLYEESPTLDFNTWLNLSSTDACPKLGCGIVWSANDMVGPKWEDEYIVLDQLAATPEIEPVSAYQPFNQLTYGCHSAHISRNCGNKEAAIRFLDLFYREDYSVQAYYGSFGTGIERNDDGSYDILVPEGRGDEEWKRLNSIVDCRLYYFPESLERRIHPRASTQKLMEAEHSIGKTIDHADGEAYDLVRLSAPEIVESDMLLQSLDTLSLQVLLEGLVYGVDEPRWNSFQSKLETAGLARLLEIYQQAYDRQ